MTVLINRLLNLSRVDADGIVIRKSVMDPYLAAREVVESHGTQARLKNLEVRLHLSETPITVEADPENFKEALSHLLENAIRYTGEGGRIDVSVNEENGSIVASVADTGVGIPREELPDIYNKFHKIERAGDEIGGVGMGLALVKAIAEAHGGTVDVESTVGRGSRFSFTIPSANPILQGG